MKNNPHQAVMIAALKTNDNALFEAAKRIYLSIKRGE